MGHKKVCLECRLLLNRSFDNSTEAPYPCPECGKSLIPLSHRFRPPKKTDDKKWETVNFLINNGFYYQHIYETVKKKNEMSSHLYHVSYPENIREAKEFVETYKDQARNE